MVNANNITLAHLATNTTAQQGQPKGFPCSWCQLHEAEFDLPFSENFVGYSYLEGRDLGLCKYCYAFLKNQSFRKKSWIADEKGVRFVSPKEAYKYLFSSSNSRWFVHITTSGQKQNWFSMIYSVNSSRDRFFISFEKYEIPIFFTKEDLKRMHSRAAFLREKGVSKKELLEHYSPKTYLKAKQQNFIGLLKETEKFKKTPQWEVVVYGVR